MRQFRKDLRSSTLGKAQEVAAGFRALKDGKSTPSEARHNNGMRAISSLGFGGTAGAFALDACSRWALVNSLAQSDMSAMVMSCYLCQ